MKLLSSNNSVDTSIQYTTSLPLEFIQFYFIIPTMLAEFKSDEVYSHSLQKHLINSKHFSVEIRRPGIFR